jgi:hypothetical protein
MTYSETPTPTKPGKVQAIAIMTFVSGILNILYGLTLGVGLLLGAFGTFGLSLCCAPIGLLPIALGIFEIIGGTKLMGTPPRRFDVQTIAIFEIINIISGAFPSLVIGILNLVFYNEPLTKDYINRLPK